MPGIPRFDEASLASLRLLVKRLSREHKTVPVRDLIALAEVELPGRWRIDIGASKILGMPLLLHAAAPAPVLARLSRRERDVAELIAEGLGNKQIAGRLGLSLGTVKDYVHHILKKTGLSNRAAIAAALSGGTPKGC